MEGSYGVFIPVDATRGKKRIDIFDMDEEDNQIIQSSTLRETTFYKTLQHTNIVKCHSIVATRHHMFIELDRGKCHLGTFSLCASYHKRIKSFNRIFLGVLHGLRFMHQNGIVHGDLKPANIVMFQDVARLIDFGGVQFKNQNIYSRGLTTFLFMSPEDALYDIFGPTNDMFALGMCMLYYFSREYHVRNTKEEAVDWFKLNPEVRINIDMPRFIKTIIVSLLNYDHTKRPTADDVINILDPQQRYKSYGEVTSVKASDLLSAVEFECDMQLRPLATAYIAELQKNAQLQITPLVMKCCVYIAKMMIDPWHDDVLIDDIAYAEYKNTNEKLRSYVRKIFRQIFDILEFNLWISP